MSRCLRKKTYYVALYHLNYIPTHYMALYSTICTKLSQFYSTLPNCSLSLKKIKKLLNLIIF
jgi:hypothetical protein